MMREAMGIEDKFDQSMSFDNPSNKDIQDQPGKSYFDEFWNDRYKDCRLFGLSITLIIFMVEV